MMNEIGLLLGIQTFLFLLVLLTAGCFAKTDPSLPSSATTPATAIEPITLSPESYDEVTKDKSVFILFYAPYCGHSTKLYPTWQQLSSEWYSRDHKTRKQGLVAEVDCTKDKSKELERWCSKDMNIVGFPTLLYGDPSHGGSFLREYNGDKDFESLYKFANDTLTEPYCSPGNPDHCDSDTQSLIEQYWKMDVNGLKDEISRQESMIDDAERNFNKNFDRMQLFYDNYVEQHESKKSTIKTTLKMLTSVKAYQANQN